MLHFRGAASQWSRTQMSQQSAYLGVLCNLRQFSNPLCDAVSSSVKCGDDSNLPNGTARWFKWVRRFPGGANGKESACQCWRHKRSGFALWVGEITWWRKWHPTPVFLPVCLGQCLASSKYKHFAVLLVNSIWKIEKLKLKEAWDPSLYSKFRAEANRLLATTKLKRRKIEKQTKTKPAAFVLPRS